MEGTNIRKLKFLILVLKIEFITEQINSERAELLQNQDLNNNQNYESSEAKESSIGQTIANSSIDDEFSGTGRQNFLFALFDLENVRQTFACFCKPRSNHVRLQIYLLFLTMFAQLLVFYGLAAVLLQFTERVYFWDAQKYSTVSAASGVVSTGIMALGSVALVRLRDGATLIIGLLADFFAKLIVGVFLSPIAFYISVPIGKWFGI